MKTVLHKFRTDSCFYIYEAMGARILAVDHDTFAKINQDETCESDQYEYFSSLSAEGPASVRVGPPVEYEDWRFTLPACDECLEDLISGQLGYLVIELTQQCNLRCKYCCYSGLFPYERSHSNRSIDLETALKAIRYYASHSFQSRHRAIAFYGGEPLLQFRRIVEICDFVDAFQINPPPTIHIDTNGILLDKRVLKELISRSIFLQISLDGPKSIHDRWRVFPNGTGSFDKIIENLETIRDIDPEYFERRVIFAVTLAPPFDLVAVDDFFAERFPNNLTQVSLVNTQDSYLTTIYKDVFDRSRYRKAIDTVSQRYLSARASGKEPTNFEKGLWDDLMVGIHTLCRVAPDTPIPCNGMCVPGQRKLFVTSDGTFHPCEKVGSAFPIGSTNKGVEIDRVRSLIQEYSAIVRCTCSGCWAVRLCRMCLARVRKGQKIDCSRWAQACKEERMILEAGLRMYASIMEINPSAFDFVSNMVFA